MGGGGELVLPALGLCQACLITVMGERRFHCAENHHSEIVGFVKRGLNRPVRLAARPLTGAFRFRMRQSM